MTDPDLATSRRVLLSGALGLGGLAALSPTGAAAAAPIPTDPASRFFLKLNGVEGESVDASHPGDIELLTWSFGVSTSADPLATSGGGAGKSKPSDLVFVARTSKASPKLYQLACTGKHLKEGVLAAVRNSNTREEYLTVKFQDLIVSSYQVAPGESDGYPIDVGHLSYAKITYSYRAMSSDGGPGATVTFGFDFAANKAI